MAAAPLLLAGLLPLSDDLAGRWCWSGAWTYPVGDRATCGAPDPDGAPGYRLLRGPAAAGDDGGRHRGADLANGRSGGTVRAAAHGLVVAVERGAGTGGYGSCVVLAHRLCDGTLAYSVYAHLLPGSPGARAGDRVRAGEPLGRVGRSGRASTDHLHFEVRVAGEPGQRWEHARATDPLAFVAGLLPGPLGDTTWAGGYLDWAQSAGLAGADARGDAPLERAAWHLMLARAARHPLLHLPGSAAGLDAALVEQSVLPEDGGSAADAPLSWSELARDLARLEEVGIRLPPGPLPGVLHDAACVMRLGFEHPARHLKKLGRHRPAVPCLADVCLVLADLAGAAPASAEAAAAER